MPRHTKPTIAITMGDPMGIGPEVIVKALPRLSRVARVVVYGQRVFLEQAARIGDKKIPKGIEVIEVESLALARTPSKRACGAAALAYIERAVRDVQAGHCQALVTGPICKQHIRAAGSPYPGHTEMLAGLVGAKTRTFLMMVGPRLKVTLTTLHEPLAKVPSLLTSTRILASIEATQRALRDWFGIRQPRLALAGLNPHAGEGGLFGDEERKSLTPAVRRARKKGIAVTGPLPGDSVFYQAVQGQFDAVISLYHDQGLIPVKLLHFDEAVNMTLGLPFVRTSVDHGTAFDIAWQNKANPASMVAAGKLAAKLVKKGPM